MAEAARPWMAWAWLALGLARRFPEALLQWLTQLAQINTLVLPGVPSAVQARRVFERSIIASLASPDGATSVGYNMRALKMAAATVTEQLLQADVITQMAIGHQPQLAASRQRLVALAKHAAGDEIAHHLLLMKRRVAQHQIQR